MEWWEVEHKIGQQANPVPCPEFSVLLQIAVSTGPKDIEGWLNQSRIPLSFTWAWVLIHFGLLFLLKRQGIKSSARSDSYLVSSSLFFLAGYQMCLHWREFRDSFKEGGRRWKNQNGQVLQVVFLGLWTHDANMERNCEGYMKNMFFNEIYRTFNFLFLMFLEFLKYYFHKNNCWFWKQLKTCCSAVSMSSGFGFFGHLNFMSSYSFASLSSALLLLLLFSSLFSLPFPFFALPLPLEFKCRKWTFLPRPPTLRAPRTWLSFLYFDVQPKWPKSMFWHSDSN